MAEGESAPAAAEWVEVPVPMPAVGRVIGFEAFGRRLLLCNADGAPFVISNECPHVRATMEGGALEGFILQCPLHGGKLDVRDGSPAGKPIRKAARCWATRRVGGRLEVGSDGG